MSTPTQNPPSIGKINTARRAAKRSGRGLHIVGNLIDLRRGAGLPFYNPGTHADRKRLKKYAARQAKLPEHMRDGYVAPVTDKEVCDIIATALDLDAPKKVVKKATRKEIKKVVAETLSAEEAPVKKAAIKVTKKVRATTKYSGIKAKN